MNELIVTYHVGDNNYYLYAYYECHQDYDDFNISYYDLFDKHGGCLNEGNPFYEFPSYKEICELTKKLY
jgi:hypothetical protein